MEHSGFGFDSLKQLLRYLEAAELPTIVRPALAPLSPHRPRARHGGRGDHAADGEHGRGGGPHRGAREISAHMGIAALHSALPTTVTRRARRSPRCALPTAEALFSRSSRRAQGVENVEAIAATDGVDGIWIGHFDLSTSLGCSRPI